MITPTTFWWSSMRFSTSLTSLVQCSAIVKITDLFMCKQNQIITIIILHERGSCNVLTYLWHLLPITFQDAVRFTRFFFFSVTIKLHLILYRDRKLHRMKIIHTNGITCVLSGVSDQAIDWRSVLISSWIQQFKTSSCSVDYQCGQIYKRYDVVFLLSFPWFEYIKIAMIKGVKDFQD